MKGGVDVNDNVGLESEADLMGTRAMDTVQIHKKGNVGGLELTSLRQGKLQELHSSNGFIQRKLKFKDTDMDASMFAGYFISKSLVIVGDSKLRFKGMTASEKNYSVDTEESLSQEMKVFAQQDQAINDELSLLNTAEFKSVQNRHLNRPPTPIPIKEDLQPKVRAEEIKEFEKKLAEDISFSGVHFRQMEAIEAKKQNREHIPTGLRPTTVMDHVDMHASVAKDELREGIDEQEIDPAKFFDSHPRIVKIVHPDAHKFIRDQFMQAVGPRGENVILQNPNMSIDPTGQQENVEKYKANERALEMIISSIPGVFNPMLKEILPTENGQETRTSFGNFMAVPSKGKDSPDGHILVGGNEENIINNSQKRILSLFASKVIIINTAWLRVGHVDEIISVIPWKDSEFGFKLLVADQRFIKGMNVDSKITELLNGIAAKLADEFGENSIARVPAAFVQHRERTFGKSPLGSLMGPELDSDKYVSAFPNMTNLAVLNDHPFRGIDTKDNPFFLPGEDTTGKVTLIVPDPSCQEGTLKYAQEKAKEDFTKIVASSGNEVIFADDMQYHVDGGDFHCATFEIRRK
jgi:hypothetical protein